MAREDEGTEVVADATTPDSEEQPEDFSFAEPVPEKGKEEPPPAKVKAPPVVPAEKPPEKVEPTPEKPSEKPPEVKPPEKLPEKPTEVPPKEEPAAAPPTEAAPKIPTAEDIRKAREDLQADITKRYAVTEEDEVMLLTEPGKVLPKMVGRLFVDVYEAVFQNVVAQLPALVQGIQHSQQTGNEATKFFFGQWPGLNKPEYMPEIRRVVNIFRQVNPKATLEEMTATVGALVSAQLKVPPPAAEAPPTSPPPKPHKPVSPGSSGAGLPAGGAKPSEFEAFIQEIEDLETR